MIFNHANHVAMVPKPNQKGEKVNNNRKESLIITLIVSHPSRDAHNLHLFPI